MYICIFSFAKTHNANILKLAQKEDVPSAQYL